MNEPSRRRFVKQAGAGAAGLMITGPRPQASLAQSSPNNTVNLAVMGIRQRGSALAQGFWPILKKPAENARKPKLTSVECSKTKRLMRW